MSKSTDFLGTVVTLMNFGAAGVGVIVILIVFFIVIRGKQADPGTLDLSKMLLRYGIGFAAVCGLLALFGPMLQPRPITDPPEMLLNFSPSFSSKKLPYPEITLPNGAKVDEGKVFVAQSGQVLVRVDDALNAISALKESVDTLAVTATNAQKQADQAVEALTKATKADGTVATAQAKAITASRQSQQATATIVEAANRGDYAHLAKASEALDGVAAGSFIARTAVMNKVKD